MNAIPKLNGRPRGHEKTVALPLKSRGPGEGRGALRSTAGGNTTTWAKPSRSETSCEPLDVAFPHVRTVLFEDNNWSRNPLLVTNLMLIRNLMLHASAPQSGPGEKLQPRGRGVILSPRFPPGSLLRLRPHHKTMRAGICGNYSSSMR